MQARIPSAPAVIVVNAAVKAIRLGQSTTPRQIGLDRCLAVGNRVVAAGILVAGAMVERGRPLVAQRRMQTQLQTAVAILKTQRLRTTAIAIMRNNMAYILAIIAVAVVAGDKRKKIKRRETVAFLLV